jgi:N-acylneuraminate cytidylyltransferase
MEVDPESTSVISVVPVVEHPARMKYLRDGVLIDPPFGEAYENQPRQELDALYIRSGAIYLVRRDTLMRDGSLKGRRSLAQVMPRTRSVNIDSPSDFELAERLMSKQDWRAPR